MTSVRHMTFWRPKRSHPHCRNTWFLSRSMQWNIICGYVISKDNNTMERTIHSSYHRISPYTREHEIEHIPTKGCVIGLFVLIIEISNGGNIWFLHIQVFNESIQRRSFRCCDVIIDIMQSMATKTFGSFQIRI